jgi:predicted SAM-dependent methyltransferase
MTAKKPVCKPKVVKDKPVYEDTPRIISISFGDIHPTQSGLCLNIGSGDQKIDGYINVDPYNPNSDAPWFANKLPLRDCSVAMIKSYQTIEHFEHEQMPEILREWFRVLKPKGELHMNTPDIIGSCELVTKSPTQPWLLARIFGNQSHDGQFHKWGYTPQELSMLVGMAGFANVVSASYREVDETLWIYIKATR